MAARPGPRQSALGPGREEMAEAAYGGAHDPGSPEPGSPGPGASCWADARQAMMFAAEVNRLAVREALTRPGDDAAVEMARRSIDVLERLGDVFRRLTAEEAVMAEERAKAYREGYAACKKDR